MEGTPIVPLSVPIRHRIGFFWGFGSSGLRGTASSIERATPYSQQNKVKQSNVFYLAENEYIICPLCNIFYVRFTLEAGARSASRWVLQAAESTSRLPRNLDQTLQTSLPDSQAAVGPGFLAAQPPSAFSASYSNALSTAPSSRRTALHSASKSDRIDTPQPQVLDFTSFPAIAEGRDRPVQIVATPTLKEAASSR